MKITIELESSNQKKINAIVALARIMEYGEKPEAHIFDFPDYFSFWSDTFPDALWELFGTIQYLLTSSDWADEQVNQLVDPEKWKDAIKMIRQETNVLNEMIQQYESYTAKLKRNNE